MTANGLRKRFFPVLYLLNAFGTWAKNGSRIKPRMGTAFNIMADGQQTTLTSRDGPGGQMRLF